MFISPLAFLRLYVTELLPSVTNCYLLLPFCSTSHMFTPVNTCTHSFGVTMPKDKRKPPVHIPLDFDAAVGGLLKVDPKKLPPSAKKPAKQTAKKAAPKKKG